MIRMGKSTQLIRVHCCPAAGSNEATVRPSFFYFLFYRFFSQQVGVGGRNKNKIHSAHFPIEFKSNRVSFGF